MENSNPIDESVKKTSSVITCHCGCVITKSNYSTHLKSQKHKKKIDILIEIQKINR